MVGHAAGTAAHVLVVVEGRYVREREAVERCLAEAAMVLKEEAAAVHAGDASRVVRYSS